MTVNRILHSACSASKRYLREGKYCRLRQKALKSNRKWNIVKDRKWVVLATWGVTLGFLWPQVKSGAITPQEDGRTIYDKRTRSSGGIDVKGTWSGPENERGQDERTQLQRDVKEGGWREKRRPRCTSVWDDDWAMHDSVQPWILTLSKSHS